MDNATLKRMQKIEALGGEVNLGHEMFPTMRLNLIVSVSFSKTSAGEAGAKLLEGLVDLKSLTIDDSEWTDEAMIHVERLEKLRFLKVGATPQLSDAGLARISRLRNLITLDLEARTLNRDSLKFAGGLSNLTDVTLRICDLAKGSLEHLKSLSHLTTVQIEECAGIEDAIADLSMIPRLECLDLGSKATDRCLAQVRNMLHLRKLDPIFRTSPCDYFGFSAGQQVRPGR